MSISLLIRILLCHRIRRSLKIQTARHFVNDSGKKKLPQVESEHNFCFYGTSQKGFLETFMFAKMKK